MTTRSQAFLLLAAAFIVTALSEGSVLAFLLTWVLIALALAAANGHTVREVWHIAQGVIQRALRGEVNVASRAEGERHDRT